MLMAALRVLLEAVIVVENQMHTFAVSTVNKLVFTVNGGNDCESASERRAESRVKADLRFVYYINQDVSNVYGFICMTNKRLKRLRVSCIN